MTDRANEANEQARELIHELAPVVADAPSFQTAVEVAVREINNRLPSELRNMVELIDVADWLQDARLMDERSYIKLQILQLRDLLSFYRSVLEEIENEMRVRPHPNGGTDMKKKSIVIEFDDSWANVEVEQVKEDITDYLERRLDWNHFPTIKVK